MSDTPTRAVRALLEHLGAAMELPDDLGELGDDDDTAAFIAHVANLPTTETFEVEIEIDRTFRLPIEASRDATLEELTVEAQKLADSLDPETLQANLVREIIEARVIQDVRLTDPI